MGKKNDDKIDFNIGASSFWILIILVALMSLSFLGIWSYQNNSIKGAIISFIFFAMIVSGILLSKFEIFNIGTFGENSLSFHIGFFFWVTIGSVFGTQSILSVSQNSLFSAIAGELPQLLQFLMTSFIIPISEELFWMAAIPFSIIAIMNIMGTKVDFFKNPWFQIFIIVLISGTTFAAFHVGKAFIAFLIAAFIFRAIMVVIVYGEMKVDLFKPLKLVISFSLGAHIGNNLVNYGLGKSWLLLTSNFLTVGWIVFLIFGIITISAINQIFEPIAQGEK